MIHGASADRNETTGDSRPGDIQNSRFSDSFETISLKNPEWSSVRFELPKNRAPLSQRLKLKFELAATCKAAWNQRDLGIIPTKRMFHF
jgi:hypothetical protein